VPTAAADGTTVEGDLLRGQRALKRRRLRRGAGGILALALAGSIAYATVPGSTHSTPAAGTASHGTHRVSGKIRLVAYTGEQAPGFTIKEIPVGFNLHLNGSNDQHLVLAPEGDNTSDDGFTNKLVIMLQSPDVHHQQGSPVTVNGEPGVFNVQQGIKILVYKDGSHELYVQAWKNIGMTEGQLIQFAQGITVIGNPTAARG
jgi:hypothetical protein